jgi:hypothetical protein
VSLTFIVGTGRCGSTMLSRLLSMHPDVLSLSEFWNCFLDTEGYIPAHDMNGEEFWRRITKTAPSYDGLVAAGIKLDEDLKPFPSRFNYGDGMPVFCRILNWLTGESPDPIYDELAPEVSAWPLRPMAEHCRALFAALANMLGRRVVVERTGGMLDKMDFLCEQFPDACFVFLHRDGPDSALSMSRYPTARLWAIKMLAEALSDPSSEWETLWETMPAEVRTAGPKDLEGLVSPPFDRERFLAYPIPLTYFGSLWSIMTRMGTREIRRVPRSRRRTLRYEHLLKDPIAALTKLADFIGVSVHSQILERACEFINPGRAGSASTQLQPSDLAALRAACATGTRAFDLLEMEDAA